MVDNEVYYLLLLGLVLSDVSVGGRLGRGGLTGLLKSWLRSLSGSPLTR
ncbi:hypothetical protein DSUL_80071 [Desulfovibrionales bacterium]